MWVIDHYRDVLRRVAWLDALCWLVVQPLGEDLGLDDVLWRVNGRRDPEQRVMAYPPEEALEADEPVVFVFEGEGAWGLLEFTNGYLLSEKVLATVSEGARVWMASWHCKGGHTVVYAADGRIRARMWEFVSGDHRQEDGDPSALAGLRTLLDGLARDDFDGKRAAVFAFTEQTAGVGFDADQLLAENVPVIVLGVPRP